MGSGLSVVLGIVLMVLCAFLVALILQLRRTAKAVQDLAEGARADIHQVAEDIHQMRNQVDQVAGLAERSLGLPAALGSLAGAIPALLGRGASPWLEAVLAVARMVMEYLKRPSPAAPEQEKEDERIQQ